MGSFRALFIAGAIATAATSLARAADMPLPPPLEPAPAGDYSGWYIRADVGVGSSLLDKFSSNAASFAPGFAIQESHLDDSAFAGVGVGYKFSNWFRFDVTGEYRTAQRFQAIESYTPAAGGTSFDTYNGSFQSSVALANGYIDLGNWYGFSPYVGAGAGVAFNRVASLTDVGAGATVGTTGNGGLGWASEKSTASFAWAAMVGVSYDLSPNVKLDIGYRYLNLGKARSAPIVCTVGCVPEVHRYELASNDIRVGLRWMFNAAPAYEAPVERPIVRKY